VTQPWPGETFPVPQRIDGLRVVAAFKLPVDNRDPRPHQYAVVVEQNPGPGYIYLALVWHDGGHGYRAGEGGVYGLDWPDAVQRLIDRIKTRLTQAGSPDK